MSYQVGYWSLSCRSWDWQFEIQHWLASDFQCIVLTHCFLSEVSSFLLWRNPLDLSGRQVYSEALGPEKREEEEVVNAMAFQHQQQRTAAWCLNGLRWMRPNLFPFLDIKAFEEASSSMTFLCRKQPQRRLKSHWIRTINHHSHYYPTISKTFPYSICISAYFLGGISMSSIF